MHPVFQNIHSGTPVYEVSWQGNMLVVGYASGDISVFDVRYLQNNTKRFTCNLSSTGVIRGLYTDGVKIVAGGQWGAINIINANDGRFINKIKHLFGPDFTRRSVQSISANETVLVSTSNTGELSVYDFSNVRLDHTVQGIPSQTSETMNTKAVKYDDKKCLLQ